MLDYAIAVVTVVLFQIFVFIFYVEEYLLAKKVAEFRASRNEFLFTF